MAIATGKACSVDTQCVDLNCKDYVCAKPTDKFDRCSKAVTCAGGLKCDSHSQRCVEKKFQKKEKCDTVADCAIANQEYCQQKGGRCEKGKEKGDTCDDNLDPTLGSECKQGLKCYRGKCRVACSKADAETVCTTGDECVIVKKDADVGFCVLEAEAPKKDGTPEPAKAAVVPPTPPPPPSSAIPTAGSKGVLSKIGMGNMSPTEVGLIFTGVGVVVLGIILFIVFFIMKKRRGSRAY